MGKNLVRSLYCLWADESGQSITEYAAIIAFVGVLVAMTFAIANNSLFATISHSFSTTNSNLKQLNQAS